MFDSIWFETVRMSFVGWTLDFCVVGVYKQISV